MEPQCHDHPRAEKHVFKKAFVPVFPLCFLPRSTARHLKEAESDIQPPVTAH